MKNKLISLRSILPVALLVSLVVPSANAQFFGVCGSGSESELRENIKTHSEHTFRLNEKFLNGYYRQRPLPSDFEPARLEDVMKFLAKLNPRKAAVLFHAYQGNRFCAWLITASMIHCRTSEMSKEGFQLLRQRLIHALGVSVSERKRVPLPRGVQLADDTSTPENPGHVLEETSRRLLPGDIPRIVRAEKIETLVVVPIASTGTLPFAALPFGDKALVDALSVVIAPGFFVFKEEPRKAQHDFSAPIIVGDPHPQGWSDKNWNYPPLPGARAEALEVANGLGSKALIGQDASRQNINAMLSSQTKRGLIYLATHGIADMTNPRDASFLLLSDGRWPAVEIQNVPLRESRPLVVMSACQTGLGKEFDVGTIGMSRAWHRAGASSVVMSLWSVDDTATRELMVNFMRLATHVPPDKALQAAMQATRKTYPNPALWAGFSVFGAPVLP